MGTTRPIATSSKRLEGKWVHLGLNGEVTPGSHVVVVVVWLLFIRVVSMRETQEGVWVTPTRELLWEVNQLSRWIGRLVIRTRSRSRSHKAVWISANRDKLSWMVASWICSYGGWLNAETAVAFATML